MPFVRGWLSQPVDILPLAVFRIAFGGLMCLSCLRVMANGWVDALYIAPRFHFKYFGFEWLHALPGAGMHLVFVALVGLSLLILLGWRTRVCIAAFFVIFTYVELIDQATYLNHYYFISLVSFLLIFLPAERALSLDAWRDPKLRSLTTPRYCIVALQLQLIIVYGFAGVAKLNSDWLLHGLPMGIWLRAHSDLPLVGPLLDAPAVALLLSWAGAFYDLTIPLWLLWRRTRPLAYATVIVFHLLTALLFPIGMFPYVMIAATLIFFTGGDFRRLAGLWRKSKAAAASAPKSGDKFVLPGWIKLGLLVFFAVQLILPLRHHLYPGDANWTMEGYRFAWRVMLNEKAGFATFRVVDRTLGRTQVVYASQHLSEQQARHMAYQPDMILQFARYLASQSPFDARHEIAVFAEVYVARNGRPARLLIDPQRDLLSVERELAPADWILR